MRLGLCEDWGCEDWAEDAENSCRWMMSATLTATHTASKLKNISAGTYTQRKTLASSGLIGLIGTRFIRIMQRKCTYNAYSIS